MQTENTDKLGAPKELTEADIAAAPVSVGAGPSAIRGRAVDLRAQAANVIVKPDGTVLVTDNEGLPVARYTDRASARTNLKASGVDFAKVKVVGNLGQDAPVPKDPPKESKDAKK